MALDKVQFFGAVDRKRKEKQGEIASALPAWYFPRKIEELQEGIARKKRDLEGDSVHASVRPQIKRDLEVEQGRLDEIMKSKVVLKGKDKDEGKTLYDEMGKQIQDSMFTTLEMKKGFADPHEEARRMKEPIISVDSKYEGVFKNLGLKPRNGKISRDEAAIVYKIMGKSLGENTNTERLRRDGLHPAYKSEPELEDMR